MDDHPAPEVIAELVYKVPGMRSPGAVSFSLLPSNTLRVLLEDSEGNMRTDTFPSRAVGGGVALILELRQAVVEHGGAALALIPAPEGMVDVTLGDYTDEGEHQNTLTARVTRDFFEGLRANIPWPPEEAPADTDLPEA